MDRRRSVLVLTHLPSLPHPSWSTETRPQDPRGTRRGRVGLGVGLFPDPRVFPPRGVVDEGGERAKRTLRDTFFASYPLSSEYRGDRRSHSGSDLVEFLFLCLRPPTLSVPASLPVVPAVWVQERQGGDAGCRGVLSPRPVREWTEYQRKSELVSEEC